MCIPCQPGILIVDDEPDIVFLVHAALARDGIAVHTATTGKQAIAILRAHPEIRLALLDVQMPGQDGPALFLEMRQIDPHLRCCFATGLIDGRSASWAQLGILRVFPKPFHLPALAEALYHLAIQAHPPALAS